MKWVSLVLGVAGLTLGIYELLALVFGWTTISRWFWQTDASAYGGLLPLLCGVLAAHFFMTDVHTFARFLLGMVAGAFTWLKVD